METVSSLTKLIVMFVSASTAWQPFPRFLQSYTNDLLSLFLPSLLPKPLGLKWVCPILWNTSFDCKREIGLVLDPVCFGVLENPRSILRRVSYYSDNLVTGWKEKRKAGDRCRAMCLSDFSHATPSFFLTSRHRPRCHGGLSH
jgi:hypothetical protein